MQLSRKKRRRLRRTLWLSGCTLLGSMPNAMADKGEWAIDSSVLFYSEVNGIMAVEPVILAKQDLGDDANLNLNVVYDSLSGATPTGGMPSSKVQTVTGPSSKQVQLSTIAPGQTPVNRYFKDSRLAMKATWSRPLDEQWRLDLGGSASVEDDFQSVGGNATVERTFDEKNTTVSAGLAYEFDSIKPIGGVPAPLGVVPAGATVPVANSRSKNIKDALLGVTQVMDEHWLLQMNFSYGDDSGYLNDYYKQVSVIASQATGQTAQGDPLYQIYENRPSSRSQRALYLRNKVYLGGDVLDVSLSHSWDTWDVVANTLDARYRWALGDESFLQPHLRFYKQSAAYFYQRGLLDSGAIPIYVSADYRLSAFTARTIGLEYGTQVVINQWLPVGTFTVRYEHYRQSGGSDPLVDIGTQQNFSLFPGLSANIVQLDYSFEF
jgi:hypothetical protein